MADEFPPSTRVMRSDGIGGVVISVDHNPKGKRSHVVWWDTGKRSRVMPRGLKREVPDASRPEEVGPGSP